MKKRTAENFIITYGRYIIFFVLFIVVSSVLLYLTYENVKEEMIGNLNVRQMLHAKQAARGIETFFDDHVKTLQNLAKNQHIIDLDEEGKKMMRQLTSSHAEEASIISRIDINGRIVHSEPYDPRVIRQTVTKKEDFEEVKRTHQIVVSDVFTNRRGFKTIIVHVPVFKKDFFNGTIALLFPFDFIARHYIEDIRIGKDGYAWMISRNGVELSCPVPGHVGNSVFDNCRDFPDILAMAERMMRGEQGVTTYQFDRIRENVTSTITKQAVFMPIHLGNNFWSIVIATPEDEVVGPLQGFRNRLMAIGGLLMISMGFLFTMVFRSRILVDEIERRRKIEEELRSKTVELDNYFTSSLDLLCIADMDGYFRRLNPEWERALGYALSELEGKRFLDFVHPDDREATMETVGQLAEMKEVLNFVNRYCHKDGSYRFIEWRSYPVGKMIYAVARDITKRKLAEEALRVSEEQYRLLAENASDIIWSLDMNLNFTYVSPSVERIQGWTVEEWKSLHLQDIMPPWSLETVMKVVEEEFALERMPGADKTRIRMMEVEEYRKNGSTFWIEVTARFVRNEEGNPVGIMGISRDITDRKKAEEVVMLDESRLEALLTLHTMEDKSLNEIIDYALEEMIHLTKSEAGYLAFTNEDETVLTMYSWSKKAMEKCRLRYNTMICPMEQTGLWTEPVRQRKPIITNDYEAPNPLKKGYPRRHFKVLRHVGVPVIEGNHVVMIAGMGNKSTDYDDSDVRQMTLMIGGLWKIIQRRRTEEEVRESQRRLADIIEFLPDATLVIDKDGKVIAWNRALEVMTGVKAEAMIGKGNYEYSLPFYGEQRPILIDLALHPDPEREGEYTSLRRTGDIIFGEAYTPNLSPGNVHLSATASVLRDSGGEIIAAIECIRNNTERKRLEAQLQQAQKMDAIGTLAGGIAHDFNNLLMAIQGNASLMLMKTDSIDSRYEKLKAIEDQVVMGAALTKQLLGFARGGRYELKAIDMNEVVEKSFAMFGRTKKEISIHEKYEKDLWVVEADTAQIEQVLMNLFINAWQAMPGGGHLYLETANLVITEDDEKSSYLKPGRYVKISVTDTGVGMDGKTKERIFEPFFTTKEMGRGTGLGLAMVYGIVKGHKGYINVYSEEGRGTTFNIYLPASDKEVLKEDKRGEAVLRGQETILLVDDERAIIDVMKEMLESLGYEVLPAGSGGEAIRIYEENKERIGLVILDMIMPEMGGGETFNRLKEMNQDIKVILSSGYSLNGEAVGIMTRGCSGFIQKPASMASLSQKVREVLGEKSMHH